jgi:hypothetical protein
MIEAPELNADFIRGWGKLFYKCDRDYDDEEEYQALIKITRKDISEKSTISKETLERILKWKDIRERIKGKVIWGRYDQIYAPRFRFIVSAKTFGEHHYMLLFLYSAEELPNVLPVPTAVLDDISNNIQGKAAGFRVPVTSTVLHFIYPDKFPIMDIRTAEVLYFACKTNSPDRDTYQNYEIFRTVILDIANREKCSLHNIDRALFAYHRCVLQPEVNARRGLSIEADKNKRRKIIDALKEEIKGVHGTHNEVFYGRHSGCP